MKLLLLTILLLAVAGETMSTECTADFCNLVDCYSAIESQCKGVFIKNGGLCGCCDQCYDAIEPGQACVPLDLSNPPTAVCKNGFWCDHAICRPFV